MLRALLIFLALANLLFAAFTQGWLDGITGPVFHTTAQSGREPERIARQISPESLTLLDPKAASAALANAKALAAAAAAKAAAPACVESGPYTPTDVIAAEKALIAQPGMTLGSFTNIKRERGGPWMVYMGKYPTVELLQKKSDELRRLRVDHDLVRKLPDLEPGLNLGRYEDHASADARLEAVVNRGVRTARVVTLGPVTVSHMLRVPQATPALRQQLGALRLTPPAQPLSAFVPCAAEAAR